MRVPDRNLDEVRERGWTVVEGFLDPETLRAAQDALWSIYPRPEDYFADPSQHARFARSQFSGLRFFPYSSWALNRLTVHPDLVDAAQRFCGTDDLHLYKIELWAKYAGAINYDQPHHRDYDGHTLVVPKHDSPFRQMTTFLLLSDVTAVDGPTKVVDLKHTLGTPLTPVRLQPGEFASEEVPVTAPAGSLFIYRTDVLHRGSDFGAPGRSRFTILADFQPRGWPWTGRQAWPNYANNALWAETMAAMTPRERQLFGFPSPDDDYWDAQTLRDVALRYPAMDMSPYSRTDSQ